MYPELTTRRALLSGAVAGAASVIVFAALHQWLISDIWQTLVPMMLAGSLCGLSVAWSYARLFRSRSSMVGWLLYNLVYVALLVLLGVASLIVYEPITTVPELLAAGGPPSELIRQATPLTAVFILFSAALIGLLWGRTPMDHVSVLLTCTLVVVLLGLNVSVLGLVHFSGGTVYLLAMMLVLTLALNLSYAAAFLLLERRTFFREELLGRPHNAEGEVLRRHTR
jgi:hypothetical protein